MVYIVTSTYGVQTYILKWMFNDVDDEFLDASWRTAEDEVDVALVQAQRHPMSQYRALFEGVSEIFSDPS